MTAGESTAVGWSNQCAHQCVPPANAEVADLRPRLHVEVVAPRGVEPGLCTSRDRGVEAGSGVRGRLIDRFESRLPGTWQG